MTKTVKYTRYISSGKKKCTKCKQKKNLSEFHKDSSNLDGLYPWCKECKNLKRREYVIANSDKEKKYREENKEKIASKSRIWYLANKERRSAVRKKYYEANKARNHAYSNARNRKAGPITKEVLDHIIWCKEQLCSYCWQIGGQHDHVLPISKGGAHSVDNIVPCCQRCNDSKGSKLLVEFLLTRIIDPI